MCAACVAQGTVYVGGALAALQVLKARATRTSRSDPDRDERLRDDAQLDHAHPPVEAR